MPPAADYEIEIEVIDSAGRARRVLLPVRLDTEFLAVRDGVRMPIQPDEVLEPGDSVITSVHKSGGRRTESVTGLWLDDTPLRVDGRPPARLPAGRAARRAAGPGWRDAHRLRFKTPAGTGWSAERTAGFQGPGESELLLARTTSRIRSRTGPRSTTG